MALTTKQRKRILVNLGFRVDGGRYKQAKRDFQGGWALGDALVVDGIAGPKFDIALAWSERRRKAGLPTASAHFSFKEFRCKCGGRYAECRRICGEGVKGSGKRVLRALILSLEKYRKIAGGFVPVSGYRCPRYNRSIGAVSGSLHQVGAACDLPGRVSLSKVKALHAFGGLGYSGSSGKVLHADRRDLVPGWNNGGTLANPMTWRYA